MLRIVLLLACLFAIPAESRGSATLGLGGQVFATGGDVIVDILPSQNGSLTNHIRIYPAYPETSSFVFLGTDRDQGTLALSLLGLSFEAGTEIVFGIEGYDGGSQDGPFFSGPPSRNYDGIAHGIVAGDDLVGDDIIESFRISFEDKTGGYDNSFNDVIVRVRQTAAPIPEPSTGLLLATGILGLAVSRRRRGASHSADGKAS